MTRSITITKEDSLYVAQDVLSGVTSQGASIDDAISNLKEALVLFYEDTPVPSEDATSVIFTTVEVSL